MFINADSACRIEALPCAALHPARDAAMRDGCVRLQSWLRTNHRSTYRFIHTDPLRWYIVLPAKMNCFQYWPPAGAVASVANEVSMLSGVWHYECVGVVDMQTIDDNAAINIRFVQNSASKRLTPCNVRHRCIKQVSRKGNPARKPAFASLQRRVG